VTPTSHAGDLGTTAEFVPSTRAGRFATALLIVVITAGAMFTILLAGGSGLLGLLEVREIYDAMAALALIPWLLIAVLRPAWRPASRLAPAIVACLVAFALSTITSQQPRLSIEMLGYSILLAELYLLLVALMRRRALRLHLERLALVLCVVVCAAYLAQALQAWLGWWEAVGRFAIPPLRPGLYLGLSVGAIPLGTLVMVLGAFGLATSQLRGRTNRAVIVAVLALISATVLVTASRGAWLGAAVGLTAVFVAALVVSPATQRSMLERLRTRWVAVVILAGIPVLGAAGLIAALSGRLTLEDGGYRAGYTAASLRIIEAFPLTGAGPGTWQVLRAANTPPAAPDLYIPHAHNLYLQTLAEFGVVGALAGIVVVVALGLLIWRALRSGDGPRRRVAYASLFTVVLLAVQQAADVLVNVPALLLALSLPIAWLDAAALPPVGPREDETARARWPMGLVPLAMAVVTIGVFVGLARIESIAVTASQGVSAADDGNWAEAARLHGEAADADPDVGAYQFQLGVSAANAGDLAAAERALAKSAAADDYAYAWLNLAAVRWRLEDPVGARDALERAERLGLQRTPVAIAAGWLRQQLGDEQRAIEDYATAVAADPTLADDPFWASASGPPGGMAAILRIVEQRAAPGSTLHLDLVLGRYDRARVDATTLSASDPEFYSLIVPAWRGDPEAWDALQAGATSRPRDATWVPWARLVASHLGDDEAVARYGRWLYVVGSGPPAVARIALGSAEPTITMGILDSYGSLYRRPVLAAQVVRLLPQVVLRDHP